MNENSDQLSELLRIDLEDLYLQIGKEIIGRTAFPPTREQLLEACHNWLNSRRAQFAEQICQDKAIQDYVRGRKKQNRLILASMILDLITSICAGVAPWTVCVALLKEGIDTLCEEHWTKS